MAEKKVVKKSSKENLLDAYNDQLKQSQDKERVELRPEFEIEKKREKAAVETTNALSLENVVKETSGLRVEIGKMLSHLADSLQEEVQKYARVREAVSVKERELQEIYGIEKNAQTLAALLDAQAARKEDFDAAMAREKDEITLEINTLRAGYEKEKKDYQQMSKERDTEENRRRQREKEEYDYAFKREQVLAKNVIEDEKVRMEKELRLKKETLEKELLFREKTVVDGEKLLADLQKRVDGFPKELDTSIQRAVKEAVERVQLEARNREELLRKTLEGEKNVLVSQLEALERLGKEQKEQIARLSAQLDKAYQKVEDIAIKSVSGMSDVKAAFQSQRIEEQPRRQGQEKG